MLPFAAADPLEWVHSHIARQPVAPVDRSRRPGGTIRHHPKAAREKCGGTLSDRRGPGGDLRRCLSHGTRMVVSIHSSWVRTTCPDRLLIPERLYGRELEVDALLTAFDRVLPAGRPELILVSGYSGIGKSAVVKELHKSLVSPRGLFASGKFDQYKRDIPYATVAQAFHSLIRPLLSRPEAELSRWRDDLCRRWARTDL